MNAESAFLVFKFSVRFDVLTTSSDFVLFQTFELPNIRLFQLMGAETFGFSKYCTFLTIYLYLLI